MMALRWSPSCSTPPHRSLPTPLPRAQPASLAFRRVTSSSSRPSKCGFIKCAAHPDPTTRRASNVPPEDLDEVEPFRGKSGSVSFHGLTHQLVEESRLESAPFKEDTGSRLWVLGPVAFIASLVLPQFLIGNFIDAYVRDEILAEIVGSLSSEAAFYAGLAAFLLVTDRVQKPYLQFSAKRWSLITGLKGYLTSAFFIMGFKVIAPLFVAYVTWPTLGPPAAVAVAPFLIGCLAQFVFERSLESRGSSSWPLVPIIFEIYRMYQLTKGLHFIEKLIFSMKDASVTPKILEKNGALVSLVVTFQPTM
uniref:Uncharacterized protein n=1 Tax=Kalanchoe fedtschenkoi TaxID=63787 RepID=A0A7N1A6L7_KALFE